ncbi:MAG: hypothetical protein HFF17_09225 [Oscillospiraceae bacterium]|nr:hypothetical protein [Oscillospiraceae bacterium]
MVKRLERYGFRRHLRYGRGGHLFVPMELRLTVAGLGCAEDYRQRARMVLYTQISTKK